MWSSFAAPHFVSNIAIHVASQGPVLFAGLSFLAVHPLFFIPSFIPWSRPREIVFPTFGPIFRPGPRTSSLDFHLDPSAGFGFTVQ